MLTVAQDATYSVGRNLSGVGIYSREILQGVARAHPEARFLRCYRPHRWMRGRREAAPANVRRRLLLPPLLIPKGDLFHGLNQRLPEARLKKCVCTFHDLFVLSGDYSTREFRERLAAQARDAAARSDLIITVSRFTAMQVESLLGVEASRLRVIPHGVRFTERGGGERRQPVVLHVGAIQRRKNIVRLVEAFEQVAPAPWKLVLAGSSGFGAEEIMARIERSPARERIEITGYVDDERLAELYRTSGLLAYPSLDEGFGIPVLEAMAQRLPVLASSAAALPEVCGDAALMVEPTSDEELACALRRMIEDDALRAEFVRKGESRAKEFSWERAAEKTWAVYRELV